MKYATTKPTACGYYWMRAQAFDIEEVVYIGPSLEGNELRIRNSFAFPGDPQLFTAHWSIEWAGPIPKPEDSNAK